MKNKDLSVEQYKQTEEQIGIVQIAGEISKIALKNFVDKISSHNFELDNVHRLSNGRPLVIGAPIGNVVVRSEVLEI